MGGRGLRPGDASTFTMELGSPGDPDVIPYHRLRWILFARDRATTLATGCLSHAFPGFIPLFAGPPPPRNTVTG
jgi:hypothetical protein